MAIGGFISDLVGPSISTWVTPALEGAATGAIGNALSGGDPLRGGLVGGLTGAGIGAFGGADGALAQALGLSGPQVNALIGALGGGLGYGVTGQNPLMGALLGGAGGYLYGGTGQGQDPYTQGGAPKEGGGGTGWTDATTGLPVDSTGNTYGDAVSAGRGGGSLGAIASRIAGGGDGSGGVSKTALALGALAALGSAMSKPKPGGAAAVNTVATDPNFTRTLNPNVPGRTAANPFSSGTPAYWAYGGPERTYFNNNSLRSFGFAEGGALNAAMGADADDGEGEFSTRSGESYVRGPGDGQSDDIPARLADGEYVLTAMDVARIGQGSNEAGARKLDKWRQDLAKNAKQTQFIPRGQDRMLRKIGGRA